MSLCCKERALEAQVKALEGKVAQFQIANIKLKELIAEAELREGLVRSFMSRARQAEEQVGLPASTSRIITHAKPASRPRSPNVRLLLVASLVLGAIVGLMLAWMMHLLHGTSPARKRTVE